MCSCICDGNNVSMVKFKTLIVLSNAGQLTMTIMSFYQNRLDDAVSLVNRVYEMTK